MRNKQIVMFLALLLLMVSLAGFAFACSGHAAETAASFTFFPIMGSVAGGGMKIINWKGMKDVKKGDEKKQLLNAFSHFARKQASMPVRGQKMRVSDPNLQAMIPIIEVVSDPGVVTDVDRGYELIFKEVDMRQARSNKFPVLDVTGGVTFYQMTAGEEAKLSRLPSTAKTDVGMLRFIGGLPILDDWINYNEYYLIDQLFEDAYLGYYDKKAQLFYGLLIALDSSINVAFDTDISTTINKACAGILASLKTKKAKNTGQKRFVITCRESDRFKIAKALAASFANANSNINEIVYNIQAVIPTTYISESHNYFYVSLPGFKNMRGEWEDFNARDAQRNELILGADQVWTGAYNGIIGLAEQHRRCALSA
ncbi:MAG: hypothetical protein AB1553_01995 [Nitrospirota bacterium]